MFLLSLQTVGSYLKVCWESSDGTQHSSSYQLETISKGLKLTEICQNYLIAKKLNGPHYIN